jgi:hypothetical protein
LGLGTVLKDVYSTGRRHVLESFDRCTIHLAPCGIGRGAFHVEIVKNRATRRKNLELEIVKFLKKSNGFKRRPPHVTLISCLAKLGVPLHISVSKTTGTFLKES